LAQTAFRHRAARSLSNSLDSPTTFVMMATPAMRDNQRSATPTPKIRDYSRASGQQKQNMLGPHVKAQSLRAPRQLLNQMQKKEKKIQKAGDEQAKPAPSIVIDQMKLKMVRGQLVDYWSGSYQCWLPATIIDVDDETGNIFLDVKPAMGLSLKDQKAKMRPRSFPSPEQVSNVSAIVINGQVQSTALSLFRSIAPKKSGGISRPADLEALGNKVDSLTGLPGSKVHLQAHATGTDGLTLERFQEILWELIQMQQEVSVQAIPRTVADACIDGTPEDKYDLGEQLGKGTFGKVLCATDKKTQERRAVKIIDKKKCGGKIEFMKMEIQNLIQLDHPHILKLHEFYNSPENLYLVTDHCSGGELFHRIRRTQRDRGSIPEAWVADVMHQLIMAICHIHARGIIHLDLKSPNIMLMPSLKTKQHFDRPSEEGNCDVSFSEKPHIMVIDLGVATIFQPGNYKAGHPMGTPATMAPEVWRGVITPKADVFSSGCVLFELLSTEMPWTWKFEDHEQARTYWSKKPRAAWNKVRFADPDAQMLLGKMLDQDRKNRIGASEILESPFLKQASRRIKSKSEAEREARAQLIRRLSTVHHRGGLYKNISLKIAKDWPPNQMPSFMRLFAELDVSGTGVLSESQLTESLIKLGSLDPPAAKRAAAAMNISQNKAAVDWTEFCAACIDLSKTKFQPAIWNIFKAADKDDDGLLSATDIEGMLPAVHAYSKEAAKNIFINLTGRWSENGGERVDWDTFATHLWTQANAGISEEPESSDKVFQSQEQDRKVDRQAKFGVFADMMDAIGSTGPQAQQFVDLLAGTSSDAGVKPPSTESKRVTFPGESLPDSMPQILQKLQEMGFDNKELNEKIIKANGGRLTESAIVSIIQESASSSSEPAAFQPPSRVAVSGLPDLPPVPRS